MFEAGNLEFDGRWIYTIKTLIAFLLRIHVTCLFGKDSLKCKSNDARKEDFLNKSKIMYFKRSDFYSN